MGEGQEEDTKEDYLKTGKNHSSNQIPFSTLLNKVFFPPPFCKKLDIYSVDEKVLKNK